MSNEQINRNDLASSAYPVGEYELEIKNCSHAEGTNRKGEPWSQVILATEIISPDKLAGKKFTTRYFYDNRLGKLITVGLKKSLDEIFGSNDKIDRNKLFDLLNGSFVKVRLGIDDKGYNTVAEVLPPDENPKGKIEV